MDKKPTNSGKPEGAPPPKAGAPAGTRPAPPAAAPRPAAGPASAAPPPTRQAPVTRPAEITASSRHRFNDSSERTIIMPLADILRRSAAAPQLPGSTPAPAGSSPFAESTKLSLNPFLDLKTGAIHLPGQTPVSSTLAPTPAASPAPPAATSANATTEVKLVSTPAPSPAAPTPRPVPVSPTTAASAPALAAAPVTSGTERNQVVVMFSCKGGSGATALACNAAHQYAHEHLKTCVVDLDLQLGDTLAALALQPRTSMARVIEVIKKGEVPTPALLPQHRSGVAVLSQVGSLEDLDGVNADGLATLVGGLRGAFDMIVVDGVRDFSENVLAVLDVADKVAVVTLQEVLAIRRGRWAFGILRKIGFDPKDITVVVNRYVPQHQISLSTLRQMFEPATVLTVARDEPLALRSLDRGEPLLSLDARHPLTKNVGTVAARMRGMELPAETMEPEETTSSRGLGDKLKFWKKS